MRTATWHNQAFPRSERANGVLSLYKKWVMYLFVLLWVIASIDPLSRADWFLETIPLVVALPFVYVIDQRFKLSDVSWICLAIFFLMPVISSHYGVTGVPFGYELGELFGTDRHSWDRLIHLSFGLLTVYPMRELFVRVTNRRDFLSYLTPIVLILAFAALYEILEWGAALTVNPELEQTFIGAQGDFWDPTKDMVLAMLGSFLVLSVVYLREKWREYRDNKQQTLM